MIVIGIDPFPSFNLPQKIPQTWPGNSHHTHDVTGGVDPVGQAANQLVHPFGHLKGISVTVPKKTIKVVLMFANSYNVGPPR